MVGSVMLRDPARPDSAEQVAATPIRSVEILSWGSVDREVSIGSGAATYLAVQENVNAGWRATLDGEDLEPITLFGWQQGFVVPPGSGGLISLEFAPSATYRAGLVVGGLLIVLLVLAALPFGRPSSTPRIGVGRWPRWLDYSVLGVLGVAVAGLAAPLLAAACWLRRWRWRVTAAIAGLAFFAAGLVGALTQESNRPDLFGGVRGSGNPSGDCGRFLVVVNLLPDRVPGAADASVDEVERLL